MVVKNLPAMQDTWVRSLHQEDPLNKEMATRSSILAWRIPGTEEPSGLPSMGSHRVGHINSWFCYLGNTGIFSLVNSSPIFYSVLSITPVIQRQTTLQNPFIFTSFHHYFQYTVFIVFFIEDFSVIFQSLLMLSYNSLPSYFEIHQVCVVCVSLNLLSSLSHSVFVSFSNILVSSWL